MSMTSAQCRRTTIVSHSTATLHSSLAKAVVYVNLAGSGSVGGPVEAKAGVELYNQQGMTLTLGTSITLDTAITFYPNTPFEYTLPAAEWSAT